MSANNSSAYKLAAKRIGKVPVFLITLVYVTFYIVAMVEKWAVMDDNTSDILKLILIIINFLSFGACLYFNYDVLVKELRFLRVVEVVSIPVLVAVALNCYMLNQEQQDLDTWFNVDYLALAMTFTLDLLFLYLYFVFHNMRSLIVTAAVVLIEIVIFAVASTQGNDDVIDTANLSITIVTAVLSTIFWSGRLSLQSGKARFEDYFELQNQNTNAFTV